MKVLHVFNEINFSGAEIMYVNAAPLFRLEGIEPIALSTGQKEGDFASQFKKSGIKVIHRPLLNSDKNPFYIYKYFKNIVTLINSEQIDVIHIHRSSFYWFFSLCGFITHKKIIRTVHNVFKNRKITWLKAYLERWAARNIFAVKFQTISKSVYENELKYYKNPSTCVNNWFDDKKFYLPKNQYEKQKYRDKLGIAHDVFIIISTGSCSKVKNHHDIIKAFAIIMQEMQCLYLHLGTGQTEEEEINLAIELKLENNIMFLGNKTNVRDYLVAADVFVMPSQYEGLGNAAIEAMACGLPSVFYNVPGLRDLITNDDNGFLITPDYNVLAEKIILFKNSPSLCKEKGDNARAFVVENYSMQQGVKGIIDLYN